MGPNDLPMDEREPSGLDSSDRTLSAGGPGGAAAELVGPYRVLQVLGEGGMGTVFKALGREGQTVAIKMIGGGLGLDRTAEVNRLNLVVEARLAAELHHPNIVKIYDVGQTGGNLYVVMEYLEGVSLDRYARSRTVSVSEALRITTELCDALAYAHSRGIVHRDVKPQNTFITSEASVKLLDFGLAVWREEINYASGIGTPPYMSPEQLLGKDLDGRTDIWSVGVTLFEVLSGTHPFKANTAGLYHGILNADVPSLRLSNPHASEIEAILRKALAKDRNARYASAGQFGEELRSVLHSIQPGQMVGQSSAQTTATSSMVVGCAVGEEASRHQFRPAKLGFRRRVNGTIFLPVVRDRRGLLNRIQRYIPRFALMAALLVLQIAFNGFRRGWLSENVLALWGVIAVGILSLVAVVVPAAVLERALSPPFFRCRSCRRKMRLASRWTRPTWLSHKYGFCVPDCVAALSAGLWEEAVMLLSAHTSGAAADSDKRFKLEFFECRKCGDQRAYLTVEAKDKGIWRVDSVREAYKFRDPLNGHKYVQSLGAPNKPPSIAPPGRQTGFDDQATL